MEFPETCLTLVSCCCSWIILRSFKFTFPVSCNVVDFPDLVYLLGVAFSKFEQPRKFFHLFRWIFRLYLFSRDAHWSFIWLLSLCQRTGNCCLIWCELVAVVAWFSPRNESLEWCAALFFSLSSFSVEMKRRSPLVLVLKWGLHLLLPSCIFLFRLFLLFDTNSRWSRALWLNVRKHNEGWKTKLQVSRCGFVVAPSANCALLRNDELTTKTGKEDEEKYN